MRQHHLRHDKICLNCGFTVEERYCSRCGQENLEPKESVGHLIRHFFEDLTHFDGKLFVTLKDLVLRPGFLTREYVAGRRMSYLNPIRMYIFISAMFFLAFFTGSEETALPPADHTHAVNVFRQHVADSLRAAGSDSVRRVVNGELAARFDSTRKTKEKEQSIALNFSSAGKVLIDITNDKFETIREYDSIQHSLPDSARNGAIFDAIMRKCIRIKARNGGSGKIHLEMDVHHDIPKIMFVLLPLFALYVGWFYNRKQYYYVNHVIFSVHFHCFLFLLFLFFVLLEKLIPGDWAGLILAGMSPILAFIYLVAALRGMYGQSFWVSLGKGAAIFLIYYITQVIALSLLGIFTFIGA